MRESQASGKSGWWAAHEDQGGIEVLIILLDIVCIVLDCLSLVHGVKV